MINLNDMPKEFYNFIFGNVVIEEFLPNITVECTYIDEVRFYGRIVIDKELNKITHISIEYNEFDKYDPEYPLETTYRLARRDKFRIDNILAIFREANKEYGYNKDIKIINL